MDNDQIIVMPQDQPRPIEKFIGLEVAHSTGISSMQLQEEINTKLDSILQILQMGKTNQLKENHNDINAE
ncbi:hypothetical protein CG395_01495 [Bifidobacteriaceae bacterium GH022]|nr:hypothetical protein CG395_01495 [Bifidobacteriaceae bacterium GH022]